MISSADFTGIKAVIFDIDGTLTDGRCAFLPDNSCIKFFDHHDMHWIKLAMRAGLKVGLLSGSDDDANRFLARELNVSFALYGVKDKIIGLNTILEENLLSPQECVYVGDDVVDMPVLRRVAIGIAVADAVQELDECTAWRTNAPGGRGAAAEIIRKILKAQGLFDNIMERYRK